jgi:hypothetical protein
LDPKRTELDAGKEAELLEENMKLNLTLSAALAALVSKLGILTQLAAQQQNEEKLPLYTITDLGTLGGCCSQGNRRECCDLHTATLLKEWNGVRREESTAPQFLQRRSFSNRCTKPCESLR